MPEGNFQTVSDADKVLLMSARWHVENAIQALCRIEDGIFRMMIGAETREWCMQSCKRAQDWLDRVYLALSRTTLARQERE